MPCCLPLPLSIYRGQEKDHDRTTATGVAAIHSDETLLVVPLEQEKLEKSARGHPACALVFWVPCTHVSHPRLHGKGWVAQRQRVLWLWSWGQTSCTCLRWLHEHVSAVQGSIASERCRLQYSVKEGKNSVVKGREGFLSALPAMWLQGWLTRWKIDKLI